MAVGDVGLDRENIHGGPPSSLRLAQQSLRFKSRDVIRSITKAVGSRGWGAYCLGTATATDSRRHHGYRVSEDQHRAVRAGPSGLCSPGARPHDLCRVARLRLPAPADHGDPDHRRLRAGRGRYPVLADMGRSSLRRLSRELGLLCHRPALQRGRLSKPGLCRAIPSLSRGARASSGASAPGPCFSGASSARSAP